MKLVKIYKDWYLMATEDGHQYEVAKATAYLPDGTPGRMFREPVRFSTAAEAISCILESEVREKVKQPDLLDLAEFTNLYSTVADEITERIGALHTDLRLSAIRKYDHLRDVETRNA